MTPEQMFDSLTPQADEYERILKDRESYGDVILIDSMSVLLDMELREALLKEVRRLSQNEKSTRRSAQMYGKDFYIPEPAPCEYHDTIYEKPYHERPPRRDPKPKNTYKQPLRTSMRSVSRNR